jgi:hypothetical protein
MVESKTNPQCINQLTLSQSLCKLAVATNSDFWIYQLDNRGFHLETRRPVIGGLNLI